MSLRGLDTLLILFACFAGVSVGAWSTIAAALFFLIALVLTANLHREAVASSTRGGPGGSRRH